MLYLRFVPGVISLKRCYLLTKRELYSQHGYYNLTANQMPQLPRGYGRRYRNYESRFKTSNVFRDRSHM